jgi:predicted XRE-type DNA-binding protein
MPKSTLSDKDRFLQYVHKTENCWNWTGLLNEHGYGRFWFCEKMCFSHRVSYILFKEEIPKNLCILHSCDNPNCVNPAHLRTGTQSENMDDKVSRDRQAKGEENGRSKLKEIVVREIIELSNSGISQKEIANQFEINNSTVSKIINKKRWKHLHL